MIMTTLSHSTTRVGLSNCVVPSTKFRITAQLCSTVDNPHITDQKNKFSWFEVEIIV